MRIGFTSFMTDSIVNRNISAETTRLTTPINVDQVSFSRTSAAKKVSSVKFGLIPHPYCGVCPICVAGAAAKAEVSNISKLRQGEDIQVTVEEASQKIRSLGKETGADVRRTSIGNEDGTRIQPLAADDSKPISIAALPRLYTPDGKRYTLKPSPQSEGKGVENGTYKAVTGAQYFTPQRDGSTFSYSCDESAPPPPLENPAAPIDLPYEDKPHQKPIMHTYGLYHHISEGPEARSKKFSQPLLLGYITVSRQQPDELLVASLRELPRFERLGIESGGLMNILGVAASKPDLENVAVTVEPWQGSLQEYIEDLKTKYGLPVTELQPVDMPKHYKQWLENAQMPAGTKIYRIGLSRLKETLKTINSTLKAGERDTQLLKSIELPDAIRDGGVEAPPPPDRNLENCPPLGNITIGQGPDPNLEELEVDDPGEPETAS